MGCFTNIVGVEGCTNAESTTGYWINGLKGLPGISIKSASSVADSETISGFELLKSCIENASQEIVLLATNQLAEYFTFGSIIKSFDYFNSGDAVTNPTALSLTLNEYCSKYTSFYVDTLTIKSTNSQTAVLTINGVNSDVVLVANIDTVVDVNASYNSNLDISIIGTNILYNTSFFKGTIQQKCDEDLFWCQFKKELAPAIRYLAGEWYYKEIIATDRYNLTTIKNQEIAVSLISEFVISRNKFLKHAIESIKKFVGRENCCCITCNTIEYTYAKP